MHPRSTEKNTESLIPDCCNLGVIFRVLTASNLVVLLGFCFRGDIWQLLLQNFIESAMLIESITLTSLVMLCGVRRLHKPYPISAELQRLICGLIPGLISYALLSYLVSMEWFLLSFPRINLMFVVFFSFLMGLLFQQYFELRTMAYSPALGEAKLQALQARIRPHFLFNSLNTALSFVRTEPRRAETLLEDLSDLFRVLMRDTRNMTSLQEEIHLCKQYLAIEKSRLGERLQAEWFLDKLSLEDLQRIEIPALLLQPLVENAVHYGVEPAVGQSKIMIEIKKNMDKIAISIVNPYHAEVHTHSGNQMALENIRQRLSLLYDIEAQISYGITGTKFEVKLYFPARR
ncbi:sensor histidine kinase [Undibacterium sp. SXout7W]|uniref:sensor histidine kinase n=1 Tax=Undibacterium sp. SXout7W TaxID=3413049 RepID=UPI003BF08E48